MVQEFKVAKPITGNWTMNSAHHARYISRRKFLRGAGVAMALPWLESIPVWGDEPAMGAGAAASVCPKRFAALFMGCGINSKHWWAKGAGEAMELGKSLE